MSKKNMARDRTPTVIRQDVSPISFFDSLVILFGAFLITLIFFLLGYAIYERF